MRVQGDITPQKIDNQMELEMETEMEPGGSALIGMRVYRTQGYPSGGPCSKEYGLLGSMLGFKYLRLGGTCVSVGSWKRCPTTPEQEYSEQ